MEDEMLDISLASMDNDDSGLTGSGPTSSVSASALLSDLSSKDRVVHASFQKSFDTDFFDDSDLS